MEVGMYSMVEIDMYRMVGIGKYNMVEIGKYNMVEIGMYSMVEIGMYNMVEIGKYSIVEICMYINQWHNAMDHKTQVSLIIGQVIFLLIGLIDRQANVNVCLTGREMFSYKFSQQL